VVFPQGTLFFKTFSDDERPIETRVLRLGEDGWEFAGCRWNEDGTDAELLDSKMGIAALVVAAGEAVEHRIPNLLECRQCHEANPSVVVGFDELRLNHSVTEDTELARMFDEGVLGGEHGTVAIELDPLSLLCRLAASVPPPRSHTVRYAGEHSSLCVLSQMPGRRSVISSLETAVIRGRRPMMLRTPSLTASLFSWAWGMRHGASGMAWLPVITPRRSAGRPSAWRCPGGVPLR